MSRSHQRSRALRGRKRLGTLVVGVLLCGGLASCGDPGTSTAPVVTADPDDVPDTDVFDFSNTVEIRDGAVAPRQTVAIVEEDIVFRNATSVPQQVRATNGTFGDTGPADSGPIAPGAEFRFRQSTPISITYEVVSQPGLSGRIQVDPGIESI